MNEQSLPTKPNHYPAESPEVSEASEEVLEQIDGSLDFSGGGALLPGKVEASKNQKMPDIEGSEAQLKQAGSILKDRGVQNWTEHRVL